MFEELQKRYNLLSNNKSNKYKEIKNFINTKLQEHSNNISRIKTNPISKPESSKSFFQKAKNLFSPSRYTQFSN